MGELSMQSTNVPLPASLLTAVADELRALSGTVEKLAGTLVLDEQVATTYMTELQSFDLIIQHADEVAALIGRLAHGETPDAAIGKVRLGAIQARLNAATARLEDAAS